MRFRWLELCRYGHFENYHLDFGDDTTDFHLIVGPNEAGKSTLLSAVDDLLFNFNDRTRYGFKFEMSELAVAALLEHGADTLEIVRRKKRKDPLTDADGNALPEAALARFLGGTTRESFRTMYGLSYARLAQGGQDILANSDDGARIVLEADGGVSGLGRLITDLEREADDIFTNQGRKQLLHLRLKDRDEAQRRSRDAIVDERQWSAAVKHRKELEAARAASIDRISSLSAELSVLQRVRRVRPNLAKLEQKRLELDTLNTFPVLPDDAEDQYLDAQRRLVSLGPACDRTSTDIDVIKGARDNLAVPETILSLRDDIETATERRSVYVRQLEERATARASLKERTDWVTQLRKDAALHGPVPPKVDRNRAETASTQRRQIAQDIERLTNEIAGLRNELRAQSQVLQDLPDVEPFELLRLLYEATPKRIAATEREDMDEVDAARVTRDKSLRVLTPWIGTTDQLKELQPLTTDQIAAFDANIRRLEREESIALEREEEARRQLDDRQAALTAFAREAGELPTLEVLADARKVRDDHWRDVRSRLCEPSVDLAANQQSAAAFETALDQTDAIADRRHEEASRIAEYNALTLSVDAAKAGHEAASCILIAAREAREAEQQAWEKLCAKLGFSTGILPSRLQAWLGERETALEAQAQLERHEAAAQRRRDENAAQVDTLRAALTSAGIQCSDDVQPDGVTARAATAIQRLHDVRSERATIRALITKLEGDIAAKEVAVENATSRADELQNLCVAILGEAGVASNADDLAIEFALADLTELASAEEEVRLAQAAVDKLDAAIEAYESPTKALIKGARLKSSDDLAADVRALGQRLAEAVETEKQACGLDDQLRALRQRLADDRLEAEAATAVIDALARAARLEDKAGLPEAIERSKRRASLSREVNELEQALLADGDGLDVVALSEEASSKPVDELLSMIEVLQEDIKEESANREAISLDLSEARRRESELSAGDEAAAALQEAAEATADIGLLTERFIASKTAAAILNWALDKHRQTRAAPLLARASTIMREITHGSVAKLELFDFTEDGKPIIVGRRENGDKLGIDAMSEGTCDQLYLALRLASLEERLATHALPFICDDLLINCDDERAALILRALYTISKRTQVLCFTHHRHLVSVADAAVGLSNISVHVLGGTSMLEMEPT